MPNLATREMFEEFCKAVIVILSGSFAAILLEVTKWSIPHIR